MNEAVRDPAIKLFGRRIPLLNGDGIDRVPVEEQSCDEKAIKGEAADDKANDPTTDNLKEIGHYEEDTAVLQNNGDGDNHQEQTLDDMIVSNPGPEKDQDQDQAENDATGKEKVLKKPDKILACPRCNSSDTKFCYYNNYNVNQPRHFCKKCQRYWTAGGTMRNVPVGAGRRKTKNSALHYRQLVMSPDGLPSPRVVPNLIHDGQALHSAPPTRTSEENGAVHKIGAEGPLCESMVSLLHLQDDKRSEMSTSACRESEGAPSCSSLNDSICVEKKLLEIVDQVEINGILGSDKGLPPLHPLPCYPAPAWAYPWNPVWSNGVSLVASQNVSQMVDAQKTCNLSSIPWMPPPIMTVPAFCSPPIHSPFIPTSFLSCLSGWPNGIWPVPWVGSPGLMLSSCSSNNNGCSDNSSPKLGKHSRDDVSIQAEGKGQKSLWAPKTLRIDDPAEAAKSSIWVTLGIKPGWNRPSFRGDIFKASNTDQKIHQSDVSQVLHANPAAFSRSQTFQETT